MRDSDHKNLGEILEENQALQSIAAKAKLLHELDLLLKSHLGTKQSEHCAVANIRQEQIIIVCDSSAWATKIHYQGLELLKIFRGLIPNLSHIKAIVEPKTSIKNVTHEQAASLFIPEQSARAIAQFANDVKT